MKLTKGQYKLLADAGREASTVVLGAIVVSGLFSHEPLEAKSIIFGILLYLVFLNVALIFKKKGNSDE